MTRKEALGTTTPLIKRVKAPILGLSEPPPALPHSRPYTPGRVAEPVLLPASRPSPFFVYTRYVPD